MRLVERLKARARALRQETYALYLAARHPDTPRVAKVLAALVAAYALSPIDLIPDFIPVLGYLDDLILVPAGIVIAVRLVPDEVMAECRARSQASLDATGPSGRAAATVVIAIWVLVGIALAGWLVTRFR